MKPFEKDITTSILASKGSGKSVFLAHALNTWHRGILIDMLGVYNPNSNYKTAIVPNSAYFTSPEAFINQDLKKLTEKKYVISLAQYTKQELIDQSDDLFRYLYSKNPYGTGSYPIFIDEVMDLANQNGKTSYELIRVAKNGRNFGIRPLVIASQRPQNVDKTIFDLSDTFYVSQQRSPKTIEYINKIVDDDISEQLRTIKPREFLRFDGTTLTKIKVPFYKFAFKQ